MGFSSFVEEIRASSNRLPNVITAKIICKYVDIILDRIIDSSVPEVLVDQESDLSSTKETVLFLDFLLLQTDPSFEVRIMDDSVRSWSDLRIEYFKFWNVNSSQRARSFWIMHWFNHLHFFDLQRSFCRKLWANTYLDLESHLPISVETLSKWGSEICSRCWSVP